MILGRIRLSRVSVILVSDVPINKYVVVMLASCMNANAPRKDFKF